MKIHSKDFHVAEGDKIDLEKWTNMNPNANQPKVHGISLVTVRGRDACEG
jgi:hypothetical protein